MTAKIKGKPYRKQSRADWDCVRVPIMRWCLLLKLANNWRKFGALLLSTEGRPIVEESMKDDFWGARPAEYDSDVLVGKNVLGRLLMDVREKLRNNPDIKGIRVRSLPIPDFKLGGREIADITLCLNAEEHVASMSPPSDLVSSDLGGPNQLSIFEETRPPEPDT